MMSLNAVLFRFGPLLHTITGDMVFFLNEPINEHYGR